MHLPPVLVHAVHDREHERRRPADQDETREALDPGQQPPARAKDDVAEADRRVGGDGEVERRLQRRQLDRSPEHDRPESDLDQMEEDDEHEEGEEEPGAANHVRGLEDLTNPGQPVDHHQCSQTLDDHAGREHREGNQDQVHGLASRELPDVPPAAARDACLWGTGSARRGAGNPPPAAVTSQPTCWICPSHDGGQQAHAQIEAGASGHGRGTNGEKEGTMVQRLVLAGGLVMLLATSSFARMADGSHCRFNRQCPLATARVESAEVVGSMHPSGAPCMRNSQCKSGDCEGPRHAHGTASDDRRTLDQGEPVI